MFDRSPFEQEQTMGQREELHRLEGMRICRFECYSEWYVGRDAFPQSLFERLRRRRVGGRKREKNEKKDRGDGGAKGDDEYIDITAQ